MQVLKFTLVEKQRMARQELHLLQVAFLKDWATFTKDLASQEGAKDPTSEIKIRYAPPAS